MLRDLKKNEKGVVFITVLMTIIIMMVLAVSILSLNVSQIMSSEADVKKIQAETLMLGILGYTFAGQINGAIGNQFIINEDLDGMTYSASSNLVSPGNLTITINY
jgi:hypothetical protein